MQEDGLDGAGLGDGGEDVAASAAAIAAQDVEGEDASQELGPGDAARAGGGDEGLGRGVLIAGWWGDDLVAPGGGGGEYSVIGHEMRARTGDEGGQAFEEDEGFEGDVGGAVGPGMGELEEHAAALVEG